MDETWFFRSMLEGIIKHPKDWDMMLPEFLMNLAQVNEDDRVEVVRALVDAALEDLSEEEYQFFVEKIAISLALLPDDIRYAVLTSKIINPAGTSPENARKTRNALIGLLKKEIIEDDKNRDGIIRTVFESILLMDYGEALGVVRGLVGSSTMLVGLDYLKYTAAWMNVLGEMDRDSVRWIMLLRDKAMDELPRGELEKRRVLAKAAIFLISPDKRKRIKEISDSISKED